MPESCLAYKCHNVRGQKPGRQFYRLPRDPDKRSKWLAVISRADPNDNNKPWLPTGYNDHWRLCSDHFITGKKSNDPTSPDFVPSVFAHTSSSVKRKKEREMETYQRLQALKKQRRDEISRNLAASDKPNLSSQNLSTSVLPEGENLEEIEQIDSSMIPEAQCANTSCVDINNQYCAALGCTNQHTKESKQQGITFYKFPFKPDLRSAWLMALRRKDFQANKFTRLCSDHFKAEDFGRTGQVVRLREGVTPSIFNFPVNKQKHIEENTYEPVKRLESTAVSSKIFKKMPGKKKALFESIDSLTQLVHHEHLYARVEYQSESCMSLDKETRNRKVDANKQPPRILNLESSRTTQIMRSMKKKDCLLCSEESACELHQKYLEKVSKEQKIFQCSICSKTMSCSSSLRRHLVSHKKSKEFKCPHCNKKFFGERELKTHIKIHVFGKKKNISNPRKQIIKQKSMAHSILKFRCHVCDDEFSDELCLQEHMEMHNDQIIDVQSFSSSKGANMISLESDPDVDPLLIEDEIFPVKEEVSDSVLSEETPSVFNRKDFIGDECFVKTEIDVDGEVLQKNICDSEDVDCDFIKVEEVFEYDHEVT